MKRSAITPLTPEQQVLVSGTYKLAVYLTMKFCRRYTPTIPHCELRSEAYLALVKAAIAYDPSRGCKFTTFGGKVIWNALFRAAHPWKRYGQVQLIPFTVLDDEDAPSHSSITDPPCHRIPSPSRQAEWNDLIRHLRGILPERSYQVVHKHILEGRTLEEIAGQFGISKQRVKQILDRALAAARGSLVGRE